MKQTAYVAFGGNLGRPESTYHGIINELRREPQIHEVRSSRLFRTRAVGGPAGQPDYQNGCIEVVTSLLAETFFERLQWLEGEYGRARGVPNAARTADLDLLLFGMAPIFRPNLLLPHPRMHHRAFVLAPLAELSPHAWHPFLQRPAGELARLLASDSSTLFVIGGDAAEAARAEERFRSQNPQRRLVHVPDSGGVPIRCSRVGSHLVGCGLPNSFLEQHAVSARDSLAVIRALPEDLPRDDEPMSLVPAGDARADGIDVYLDSLEPPLEWQVSGI